ncbi:LOW QUALITY PROTEIN: gastrotropin [Brienomyrus brachyistius]|uniref:LOW QUALITY PROTEIN: gastrotropin n=1 Tax=Brienomyrus brachyistius TaxID=42636 RepID=UPI0020B24121|nr:LOW QUALITY PROTEIN: gastrotropin [Brienomyrus brachyistius]
MSFTGKYEIESQENYDEFLKLVGLPDDVIEKGRNFKVITEVVQDGSTFVWSQTYPNKTVTNKFVIGQECEMEALAGKKSKVTVTMEGSKFVRSFPKYHLTAEVCGDKLVECSTASTEQGNVTLKRTSKRI